MVSKVCSRSQGQPPGARRRAMIAAARCRASAAGAWASSPSIGWMESISQAYSTQATEAWRRSASNNTADALNWKMQMDLSEKIRTLPTGAGCYLYKNAEGEVIYVGKAKNLRARVRSYFLAASQANAKTGSLMREAVDLEYILVANEREALALENNLIKQRKPRFNILLRDDKTYPYIKLTLGDKHPKVFVTRRLRKDGSAYFGPYFPANLAPVCSTTSSGVSVPVSKASPRQRTTNRPSATSSSFLKAVRPSSKTHST